MIKGLKVSLEDNFQCDTRIIRVTLRYADTIVSTAISVKMKEIVFYDMKYASGIIRRICDDLSKALYFKCKEFGRLEPVPAVQDISNEMQMVLLGPVDAPIKKTGSGFQELSKSLPGINEQVKYPCDDKFGRVGALGGVIMHLNDTEKWSRDRIADWIESLDIDTEFH